MKYVALICLVIQNAALILLMRYNRTRPGDKFFSSTAVVLSEIMKLLTCLAIMLYQFEGVLYFMPDSLLQLYILQLT